MDDRGVRVRPARRRLRHRQLDAPAEEEPRHRRAGPREGRSADRQPHRPPRHPQGPARSRTTATCRRTRSRSSTRSTRCSSPSVRCRRPRRHARVRRASACRRRPTCPTASATDLAEHLVEQGTPFRDAHAIVGALVRQSLDDGADLADLVRAHPALGEAAVAAPRPRVAVTRRTTRGGAGPVAGAPPAGALPGPPRRGRGEDPSLSSPRGRPWRRRSGSIVRGSADRPEAHLVHHVAVADARLGVGQAERTAGAGVAERRRPDERRERLGRKKPRPNRVSMMRHSSRPLLCSSQARFTASSDRRRTPPTSPIVAAYIWPVTARW